MGGLGRASSRHAEQSSRGGRRAGQTATLQQHAVSYTPGTRQTRPTKKVTFPRYKAEKSPFQQHDLSILIVGPNQLKYRLSRTRKPKSHPSSNTQCPITRLGCDSCSIGQHKTPNPKGRGFAGRDFSVPPTSGLLRGSVSSGFAVTNHPKVEGPFQPLSMCPG